jgi:hypothetical protein
MEANPLFMLTTQDRTSPENSELFAKKICSASPYTQRTHLISHHPTFVSSDISNIVCRESLFHHPRNYRVVQKSVRYPSISTDNLLARLNLLSSDAWFVLDLIAFLDSISSTRYKFFRLHFGTFIILTMSLLLQQRSVIRYFVLGGKSNQQITVKLAKG